MGFQANCYISENKGNYTIRYTNELIKEFCNTNELIKAPEVLLLFQ